ncbi:hypothetical protein, partial [uncultured Roseibium sp.]|uniref:hypothetical protein n=1 Tax=uncultured Roseibium sp. TaxID=1936171 RepID=UPI00261662C1
IPVAAVTGIAIAVAIPVAAVTGIAIAVAIPVAAVTGIAISAEEITQEASSIIWRDISRRNVLGFGGLE